MRCGPCGERSDELSVIALGAGQWDGPGRAPGGPHYTAPTRPCCVINAKSWHSAERTVTASSAPLGRAVCLQVSAKAKRSFWEMVKRAYGEDLHVVVLLWWAEIGSFRRPEAKKLLMDGVIEVSSAAGPTIPVLIDLIRSRDNHRCRPKRRRYCGAAPQLAHRRLLSPPKLAIRAEPAPTSHALSRHTVGGKVSLAASGWVLPGCRVDDDAHSLNFCSADPT